MNGLKDRGTYILHNDIICRDSVGSDEEKLILSESIDISNLSLAEERN